MNTVIALDVGHSAVKVVADTPSGRHQFLFPSVASMAIELSEPGARESAARETVVVDGKKFFFGQTAVAQGTPDAESGMNENWITAPEYSALVLGAFLKLEQMPDRITHEGAIVVVGLPSKFFSQQRPILSAIMKKLAPHAKILVLPQPLGPFNCIQLDADGKESTHHNMSNEAWGVIEIGHYTTDFGVVRSGSWIEKNSGSCPGGHVLVERVVSIIKEQRGYTLPLVEATKAIATGSFKDYGNQVPIAPFVNEAAAHLITVVMNKANQLLDADARTLDGIVVAGGGASLIFPAVAAKYPHAVIAAGDPRMTVAEGFCRFGCAARNDMKIRAERQAKAATSTTAA